MREYELAVLLHPDLEIDQAKALGKIDKMIAELKGKVISGDDWGKRKLAYPIARQQFGLYFFYILELEPAKVAELERYLKLSNEVLRYLVVKYEPVTQIEQDKPPKTKKAEEPAKPVAKLKPTETTAKSKEDK